MSETLREWFERETGEKVNILANTDKECLLTYKINKKYVEWLENQIEVKRDGVMIYSCKWDCAQGLTMPGNDPFKIYCNRTKLPIHDPFKIPEWCPRREETK